MNKKYLMWIISILVISFTLFIVYRIVNSREETNISELKENSVNISEISNEQEGEVTDECVNEWADYEQYLGEKIEEASSNLSSNDTHYILKDVDGYIQVFYLDQDGQEVLYKKTSIATDYLSQEDIDDLEIGIEVVGSEALNKMLEDFE